MKKPAEHKTIPKEWYFDYQFEQWAKEYKDGEKKSQIEVIKMQCENTLLRETLRLTRTALVSALENWVSQQRVRKTAKAVWVMIAEEALAMIDSMSKNKGREIKFD